MLIRLFVENFLSFGERTSLSMVAGKNQRHQDSHIIKLKKKDGFNLLKLSVIYGANASGKSNLIKALSFIQNLVLNGTTKREQSTKVIPFKLDAILKNSPTRIEVEFRIKEINYAYGFIINSKEIVEEWLYEIGIQKDKLIFERKTNSSEISDILFSDKLNKTEEEYVFLDYLRKSTRNNQLFITECFSKNVKANIKKMVGISNTMEWFKNNLLIIFPDSKFLDLLPILETKNSFGKNFEKYLRLFDSGIEGLQFKNIDFNHLTEIREEIKEDIKETIDTNSMLLVTSSNDNMFLFISDENGELSVKKLFTKHKVNKSLDFEDFNLNEESDGTRRLFDLIPTLINIRNEKVVVVDELNRSLHPLLSKAFIDMFLDVNHENNSQLIFTTHEENLLDLEFLRKDEIWFVEKNNLQQTKLYSLAEFKDVRFDKRIKNDYLLGRYGAIPNV